MAETIRRILRLLDLLQSRPVWSGPELAGRLGVTDRTIRRDVERLRELGYPVEGEHGSAGGYRLRAGRELPPLLLDDEEAIAIAVSLRGAATSPVSGVGEAALRALAKLDTVFPPRLRAQVAAVQEVTTAVPRAVTEVGPEVLVEVARAARGRVQLRFDYTTRAGAVSARRVEPYRIVTTGLRWYLMAFDLEREDWRTFRLDRIASVHVTTFRFTPRPAPDAAEFVQQAITRSGYRHQVEVVIGAPVDDVRARIPATVGTVKPAPALVVGDGRSEAALVRVGGDDLDGVAWHLAGIALSLDATLTVLSPPELDQALARLGRAVLGFSVSGRA